VLPPAKKVPGKTVRVRVHFNVVSLISLGILSIRENKRENKGKRERTKERTRERAKENERESKGERENT
jgi:hypothetical protein